MDLKLEHLSKARIYITGDAGFIGSNLVDRLLSLGAVHLYGGDNLSTGRLENLRPALQKGLKHRHANFALGTFHLLDSEVVFHFAANADIRHGADSPHKDLEQNTLATFHVLEAMRKSGVRRIVFASSAAVYGEPAQIPTPESAAFPLQTSLYGASKLACEALIQAYCETYGMQAVIFRFASVLGPRYAHGHVIDFVRQLQQNPGRLRVLGDGHQAKSYVHVSDCVDGILSAVEACWEDKIEVFNIATDAVCHVTDSVKWITLRMGLNPQVEYTGGKRGWIGDSPLVRLSIHKLQKKTGWTPRYSIPEAIEDTVDYLTAIAS